MTGDCISTQDSLHSRLAPVKAQSSSGSRGRLFFLATARCRGSPMWLTQSGKSKAIAKATSVNLSRRESVEIIIANEFEASCVSAARNAPAALGMDALAGALLAACGTLATALGNHLVHRAHGKKSQRGLHLLVAGNVLITVVGTAFGLAAFAFAPQSLVAPLGGLTIVWNALLATLPYFGGARLSNRDIWSTAACLVGCVTLVAFGPRREPVPVDPLTVFSQYSFAVLFFASLLGALALDGVADFNSVSKDLRRLCLGSVGGIVGGLSNVFAKSAVVSGGAHNRTETIILVLAGLCSLLQLLALNRALARYPPFAIVPVYQVSLLIAATVSGIISFDYDEFMEFSWFQLAGFVGGVALCVAGIINGFNEAPALDKDEGERS